MAILKNFKGGVSLEILEGMFECPTTSLTGWLEQCLELTAKTRPPPPGEMVEMQVLREVDGAILPPLVAIPAPEPATHHLAAAR